MDLTDVNVVLQSLQAFAITVFTNMNNW